MPLMVRQAHHERHTFTCPALSWKPIIVRLDSCGSQSAYGIRVGIGYRVNSSIYFSSYLKSPLIINEPYTTPRILDADRFDVNSSLAIWLSDEKTASANRFG
ncbi:hypothetical protein [Crenothrix sp.]|uniref:hypothetical protein n=1 Tax=Crenothrix sp. TaxID=3100433 RepID=UPI00374C9A28